MARLSLKLLGSMQVTLDGSPIESFESDKTRALLAYLAVENTRPHSRVALAEMLWPNQPEGRARHSLSQVLYSLRLALGDRPATGKLSPNMPADRHIPFLLITPHSIQINPQANFSSDVAHFKELLTGCGVQDHTTRATCKDCMQRFQQAVSLYTSDFLADLYLRDCLAFEEWATVIRERLRNEVQHALDCLTKYHEQRAELELAMQYAHRQVTIDPLWETAQRFLMRSLAQDGQRSAALAQYEALQHLLETELHAEPERETTALYERLRIETDSATTTGELPQALTPFIGRQDELLALGALLRDPSVRLITLLGPGGSGKTRLALEAARPLRYHYTHGVYLVPLSSLDTPASLLPAIIEALGLRPRESDDPHNQLCAYMKTRRLLLLLDSFERLLEGAPQLADLLRLAPGLKMLVTSRARLDLKGEQLYLLGGMSYSQDLHDDDPLSYSAVQLFLTGARRMRPGFQLAQEDAEAVVRICKLVDGMPLGILLASAWVAQFSPAEIANHVERSLDFLSIEWRDIPHRQRSLRATFDYSWNLLAESEQQALAGMSVFRGSFNREAAQQVAGAGHTELRGLVAKSMLQVLTDGRCQLHDLVYQFASDRLAANPDISREIHQQHCDYYFELLRTWGEDLKGVQQMEILSEMDQEIGNLQAAWAWVVSNADIERLDLGMNALGEYYRLRARHYEARLHFEPGMALLAQLTDTPENRLKRVDTIIKYSFSTWRYDPAECLGRLAEAECLINTNPDPDEERLARLHFWMGRAHYAQGTTRDSLSYFQRMLPLAKKLGDPEMMAIPSSNIAQALLIQGYLGKAEPMLSEAIPVFEAQGNWHEWIRALGSHAITIARMGEYQAGLAEARRILERAQELSDASEIAYARGMMIMLYFIAGNDLYNALQAARRGIKAARQSNEWGYVYIGLGAKGWVEARLGRLEEAEASMAQAQAILQEKLDGHYVLADMITVANAELALLKGDIQEAIELAQKAISMAQAYGGIFVEGLAHTVWGQALAKLTPPQWEQADVQMAEGIRVLESGQNWLASARTHVAWGEIYREQGNFEAAYSHWETAAKRFETSGLTEEMQRTLLLIDDLA